MIKDFISSTGLMNTNCQKQKKNLPKIPLIICFANFQICSNYFAMFCFAIIHYIRKKKQEKLYYVRIEIYFLSNGRVPIERIHKSLLDFFSQKRIIHLKFFSLCLILGISWLPNSCRLFNFHVIVEHNYLIKI